MNLLNYNAKTGAFNFPKLAKGATLDKTHTDYNDYLSTYRIQFCVHHIFD
jgi:hypothetical protein